MFLYVLVYCFIHLIVVFSLCLLGFWFDLWCVCRYTGAMKIGKYTGRSSDMVVTNVRLPRRMMRDVKLKAAQDQVTVSNVVRSLIIAYLEGKIVLRESTRAEQERWLPYD